MRAITGRTGLPVPTQPLVRPASWPARPPRVAWTSPIPAAPDQSAARAAAREAADAAARAALAEARAAKAAEAAAAKQVRVDVPVADIVAAYAAGRSLRDIAADYGVTRRVIAARLHDAGVPLRAPGGQAKPELAGLVTAHGDYVRGAWADPRLSIQQIADACGVHRDTAKAIARTLGLPPRNRPGTRRSHRAQL